MNQVINRTCTFLDLGMLPFEEAWSLQTLRFNEILEVKNQNRQAEIQTPTPNYLFLVEHPPVYTLGKSGNKENLLLDDDELVQLGASYYPINRGGDITYHGPGQLVMYPVIDLENFFTDIHKYMRSLEQCVINTCHSFGIEAGRIQGLTGVWVQKPVPEKICALGVKTSRWVTMHGLALNVNTNLEHFNHIIPCGISDKGVTSIQKETGNYIDMNVVKNKIVTNFCNELSIELI